MPKPGPKPKFTLPNLTSSGYQLARKHGIEQLTLVRLATQLNTSASALYRYFPNKEHLVNAIRVEALRHGIEVLSSSPCGTSDISSDIRENALHQIVARYHQWGQFRTDFPITYELLLPTLYSNENNRNVDGLLNGFQCAFDQAVRVAALRPANSRQRALLLITALDGVKPYEDIKMDHSLVHTLLCGWGASRPMLDAAFS